MDLVESFMLGLPPERLAAPDEGVVADGTLGELLRERVAEAQVAHPQVAFGAADLATALGSRIPATTSLLTALRGLRAADVFVACAAAVGDRHAIATVQGLLAAEVRTGADRARLSSAVADDIRQRLGTSLLVPPGDGRAPAIAGYAGRGDLRGFLRVAAMRECVRFARQGKREIGVDADELAALAPAIDPDIDRLKDTYRGVFSACFAEALAQRTPRERAILRHHAIDRLSIDEIGALYDVHRATAARWLERTREAIAAATEALLAARLAIGQDEAASVIRLVRSQLDVTLERLLR